MEIYNSITIKTRKLEYTWSGYTNYVEQYKALTGRSWGWLSWHMCKEVENWGRSSKYVGRGNI